MLRRMLRVWSQDGYLRALRFAAEAHLGQTVAGGPLPYLVHVAGVAQETAAAVAAEGAETPDLAVQCALLHDVLEDTGVEPAGLEAAFGPAVLAGVAALTKDAALPKSRRMADSLERIRREPREVWLVKLADRIVNLQKPPAHWSADKIAAYGVEAGAILAALGPASPFLAARLEAKRRAYPPAD